MSGGLVGVVVWFGDWLWVAILAVILFVWICCCLACLQFDVVCGFVVCVCGFTRIVVCS